jgi:hypothetical protein
MLTYYLSIVRSDLEKHGHCLTAKSVRRCHATTFLAMVTLKTAKMIGIEVLTSILLRADNVVE